MKDEASGAYYVEFTNTKGPNYPFTEIYKELTHVKDKGLNFAYESLAFDE